MDPVVIVGAGPAGLLLARYLQLHHIPVVVYERDAGPSVNNQGGSLDLHADTGLKALRETDLLRTAEAKMRPEGDAMKIMNPRGDVLYDENTQWLYALAQRGRPEIDRTDLRNILLDSLSPGTIQWDHALTSARLIDNDTYELSFKSQPPIQCSLLVGADGAFSRIRPLLHPHKPAYTGLSMYDLLIPSDRMTPELKRLVGAGAVMAMGGGRAIMPQMNSGGRCKVYAGIRCPVEWVDEHPLPDKGRLEFVASQFPGWDESLLGLIRTADEEQVVARRIWAVDPQLTWESDVTGVTVVGDGAHVMSPFAGEGVNQALADALDLGRVLVAVHTLPRPQPSLPPFPLSFLPLSTSPAAPYSPPRDVLHKALRGFEKKMMARARPEMVDSAENLEMAFSENGGEQFAAWFDKMWWLVLAMTVATAPVNALKKVF